MARSQFPVPACWGIDLACASLFLVDYAVRFSTCFAAPWSGDQTQPLSCWRTAFYTLRNLVHFVFNPLNLLDMFATLPTIAALAIGSGDPTRRLLALKTLRYVVKMMPSRWHHGPY